MKFQGMMLAIAVAALPAGAAAQAHEASDDNDRAAHAFLTAVDLGEVQMSMLATQRAASAEVRTFAQSMIADHSSAMHTREMLMQTENSGLVQRMGPNPNGQAAPVRPSSNPAAGGIAGAGPAAGGPAATGAAPATAQVPVGANANSNPAAASTVAGQASVSGGQGAHAGHGNMQGGGNGSAGMQGDAHAGHAGMDGMSLPPGVTPAMVQQLEATLAAHPMSRGVMEANARNLQVLQGVNGPAFDTSYMDAQIGAHRYALAAIDRLLGQTGALGDDIRGTLTQMRTAVASHLQMAEQIRGRLP